MFRFDESAVSASVVSIIGGVIVASPSHIFHAPVKCPLATMGSAIGTTRAASPPTSDELTAYLAVRKVGEGKMANFAKYV